MVSVFIAHDPRKDEWVCQLPIFPPYQKREVSQVVVLESVLTVDIQDFTDQSLQDLLRAGLGIENIPSIQVEVLSTNTWSMQADLAQSFANQHQNVFLVGDAAHRFPPAGGFGMNRFAGACLLD